MSLCGLSSRELLWLWLWVDAGLLANSSMGRPVPVHTIFTSLWSVGVLTVKHVHVQISVCLLLVEAGWLKPCLMHCLCDSDKQL